MRLRASVRRLSRSRAQRSSRMCWRIRRNSALPVGINASILRLEGWQNGYCTGLENRRPQGLGGSNPSPSVGLTLADVSTRRVRDAATRRRPNCGTEVFRYLVQKSEQARNSDPQLPLDELRELAGGPAASFQLNSGAFGRLSGFGFSQSRYPACIS